MKRRELIKPDLESPFTKLCKPEIAPTTKLFGDDLSKQLKELTEVSRVGKQLQKKAQNRNVSTRNHMTDHGIPQTERLSWESSLFWRTAMRLSSQERRTRKATRRAIKYTGDSSSTTK